MSSRGKIRRAWGTAQRKWCPPPRCRVLATCGAACGCIGGSSWRRVIGAGLGSGYKQVKAIDLLEMRLEVWSTTVRHALSCPAVLRSEGTHVLAPTNARVREGGRSAGGKARLSRTHATWPCPGPCTAYTPRGRGKGGHRVRRRRWPRTGAARSGGASAHEHTTRAPSRARTAPSYLRFRVFDCGDCACLAAVACPATACTRVSSARPAPLSLSQGTRAGSWSSC